MLRSLLLLAVFFILTAQTPEQTAVTSGAAAAHADFALGYLHCDLYSGVNNAGGGTPSAVRAGIQLCIDEAWANALTAYLACGTYVIDDTLKLYEWANFDGSGNGIATHTFRGSKVGGCQPEIKLATSAPNFDGSPRPMMALRRFEACKSQPNYEAPLNNDPLALPPVGGTCPSADWKDGQANYFQNVIENIHFNTNGHSGAIGLTAPGAQNSGIYNIKVTATNSFAGVYGLPGRNSVAGNVEVIGGQHCVGSGPNVWGLGLDNVNGVMVVGLTCTNQTSGVIEINDGVTGTIVGASITRNSGSNTTPVITVESPLAILDTKITLTGTAANTLGIYNGNASGCTGGYYCNLYMKDVYFSGTTNLVNSGGTVTSSNISPWVRLPEYVYNIQYSGDGQGSNFPGVYPDYPKKAAPFEARAFINGSLSATAFPIPPTPIAATPPTDLVSRHIWTALPSFDNIATCSDYTNPVGRSGCTSQVVLPGQKPSDFNTGPDCKDGLQSAIDAAFSAGHNCVHLPRGQIVLTDSVNLHKDTKLMGAGMGLVNMIGYKSTWSHATETPFITTDTDATGTGYMGFFSMFVRTNPFANQFNTFWHWRLGKDSMTVNIGYDKQYTAPTDATQPLKMVRFSGGGGGRHYGIHNSFEQYDSNVGARMVYAQGTRQPLSLYGQNLETSKAGPVGSWQDANMELNDVNPFRSYGTKREGNSPTAIVTNSDNVAIYGIGSQAPVPLAGKGGYLQFINTPNYLVGMDTVRQMDGEESGEYMLREVYNSVTTNVTPWPTGITVAKRGTINDTPFGVTASVNAPDFLDAETTTANDRVLLRWQLGPGDSSPMTPASNPTGLVVKVGGSPVTIIGSTRVGLSDYLISLQANSITLNSQVVTISYTPGNIASGAPGTPPALAFTDIRGTVTNQIPPGLVPVLTQTTCAFRSLYGAETPSEGWYIDESAAYENQPVKFIPGGQFRVRCKVTNTVVAAPTRALTWCYDQNESGVFVPLTDDCSAENTCFADAPDIGDGAMTTQLLTPEQGTFIAGGVLEHAATQVPISLPINSETEYEAGVQLKTSAPIDSVNRYRLCEAGGIALNGGYASSLARVQVIKARSNERGGGTSK